MLDLVEVINNEWFGSMRLYNCLYLVLYFSSRQHYPIINIIVNAYTPHHLLVVLYLQKILNKFEINFIELVLTTLMFMYLIEQKIFFHFTSRNLSSSFYFQFNCHDWFLIAEINKTPEKEEFS